MNLKKLLALSGALLALSLAAVEAAAANTLTVRVEGAKKTLLAPTRVKTHSGWITAGGTPRGQCSSRTAAGALDVATHHRWGGLWDPKYAALSVTSIFGERHSLSSPVYWSVWVDNAFAQSGICGLRLHRGEQLLFAAIPDSPQEYPVAVEVPRTVVAGHAFTVKVVRFSLAGKPSPLAGAMVSAGGISAEPVRHSTVRARTNSRGLAKLTEPRLGLTVIEASKDGYIRSAPVTRDVI